MELKKLMRDESLRDKSLRFDKRYMWSQIGHLSQSACMPVMMGTSF
jgi:hypothetical protein